MALVGGNRRTFEAPVAGIALIPWSLSALRGNGHLGKCQPGSQLEVVGEGPFQQRTAHLMPLQLYPRVLEQLLTPLPLHQPFDVPALQRPSSQPLLPSYALSTLCEFP